MHSTTYQVIMLNNQLKLAEDQFIVRLRENLKALSGLGSIQMADGLQELRRLTEGRMLRAELEAVYPMGKALSVQVAPKRVGLFAKAGSSMTVVGRVVVDLANCVNQEGSDEPVSLTTLHGILNGEAERMERSEGEGVLGLMSPTGWDADAVQFVRNDPPGSGWASGSASVILVGPTVTDLAWDLRDARVSRYTECFCGLTLSERQDVCREKIKRALLVQAFANLETIAQETGFVLDFVKDVGKVVASGDRSLSLKKISGVGWVVKKRL